LHAFVVPHRGQPPPPQSVSVSVPFFAPSVHRALVHTERSQKVLAQSLDFLQAFPIGQGWQAPPPQSTSVSTPFGVASVHDGVLHTPSVHTALMQSFPRPHGEPG
jgi:hypothetical protein